MLHYDQVSHKQHPTMGAEEVMYQCILTTNPGGINTKPFFIFFGNIYLSCPYDIGSSLGKPINKWMDRQKNRVTMSLLELLITAIKSTPHCPQQQTNPEILT